MTESRACTDWTVRDSFELYGASRWGAGFFGINEKGNVEVCLRDDGSSIDLLELVQDLERRDLRTPLLIRFSDILAGRIEQLCGAFAKSIETYGYGGSFRGVYPIKVNQQHHVVEEIIRFGAPHGIGLEAGSKSELLIALAMLDTEGALLICNGYKDRAYIELALLAQRLGRNPILVVDRYSELDLIIKTSTELGIRPRLGIRARLTSKGGGRWGKSTGDRAKFGLSAAEIVGAVNRLRTEDMLDCLQLLHFHVGSQISAIRDHKDALAEGSRIFTGLFALGASPSIVDVGGGLGVDYGGSQSDVQSSVNYTLEEYTNDVVAFIQEACDEASVPHPDLVTEGGRAMVAHHSVLVFDVVGVDEVYTSEQPEDIAPDAPKIVRDFSDVLTRITSENLLESFHDAVQLKEEAGSLFSLGYLDLETRARTERMFWKCCTRVLRAVRNLPYVPEELRDLEKSMADTYYGNFSVFQSAPDHWAVEQLFPVMPIHRLDEEPTRRGVIADLTCDSDGKIDKFIDPRAVKNVLELHPFSGAAYYIGVFMVGAYQEILGDLHNLFGDTDAVHVRLSDDGGYTVDHVVEGDTVAEVLQYVQHDPRDLIERVRRTIEKSLHAKQITLEESAQLRKRYEQGLREHTYLSRDR